jgi:hypothetical protein
MWMEENHDNWTNCKYYQQDKKDVIDKGIRPASAESAGLPHISHPRFRKKMNSRTIMHANMLIVSP